MQNQQTIALGYMRIWQIVGDRERGIELLLPVGRSSFLAGVKSGKCFGRILTWWRGNGGLTLATSMSI